MANTDMSDREKWAQDEREQIEKEAEAMYEALGHARDYIRVLCDNEVLPCSAADRKAKLLKELAARWNKSAKKAGIDP